MLRTTLFLTGAVLCQSPDLPKGRLVIAGGGPFGTAFNAQVLELAGGKNTRVLVVPQASSLEGAGEGSAEKWRTAGARVVAVLDLHDLKKAVAAVRSADLIWLGGGDQNRLMRALKGTGVAEAIRDRFREGATVGGTSAGAAVMSAAMITGEADLGRVAAGTTKLADGLGLWPAVIVDQHFLKRQRFNRLLGAVLDRPELLGVGIDESTAVIVSGAQFEVVGTGSVVVIDARKAVRAKPKPSGPAAGSNLTLHVLTAGMKFHLEKGKSPE